MPSRPLIGAGLLGFNWRVDSYPENNPPPGGGVGFELLSDAQGHRFVRAFFRSQIMDQMRNLTPLSLAVPAFRQYLAIPGCNLPYGETVCSLETFSAVVRSHRAPGAH